MTEVYEIADTLGALILEGNANLNEQPSQEETPQIETEE